MKITHPTFLIAELAGDVVPLVSKLRRRFNPTHNWPVDITIAGSSGLGTIRIGQELERVIDKLHPIINSFRFTHVIFNSISRFPNTGIYYLAPERKEFDQLHKAVAESGVLFEESQWPYNPHCTIRSGSEPNIEYDRLLYETNIPYDVTVECFSLYQPFNGGGRLHRF